MKRLKQVFETIELQDITISDYKEEGKLCGYELNTYSKGGVNQIVFLDFRDGGNPKKVKDFISEFKSYVKSIDVEEQVDLHRQDVRYKEAFTLKQSLKDFKSWKKDLKVLVSNINKQHKRFKKAQSLENDKLIERSRKASE